MKIKFESDQRAQSVAFVFCLARGTAGAAATRAIGRQWRVKLQPNVNQNGCFRVTEKVRSTSRHVDGETNRPLTGFSICLKLLVC